MKKWQLYPAAPDDFLNGKPDFSKVLLQLLYNRGLSDPKSLDSFLHDILPPEKTLDIVSSVDLRFYDPFLFKNMEAVVALIISHIKKGNKIVVYGDYDADGVTSSVVLFETLKILQAKVEVYLPDRVSEGYGLNRSAIDQIVEQGFSLLITVDNGIRNKAEVIYAQEKGLEIIITDHHILPDSPDDLPPCLYINPADRNDSYPWPYLAGVGVAFKLASALVSKADLSSSQKKLILEKSLDLVAVGTIADMVSLLGENRLLVKRGLNLLNQSKRPGLAELVKISKGNGKKLEAWNVGWQIGPRLNAASRLGHANNAFALLTADTEEEAARLADELNQRNQERQKITEEIISQVEQQIDPENVPPIIIGLAGGEQTWNEGVIGLVAGRICEKYYRPTLVITRLTDDENKISFKASGRSIEDLNLIETITEAGEFLDKYGGHPMACGFSVEGEDKLEKFKEKVSQIVAEKLAGKELSPRLKIEAELPVELINISLAEEISLLAPFGQNNNQPKFVSYNLRVDEIVTLGFDSQHIKFRLSDASQVFAKGIWAISFGCAEEYKMVRIGDMVNVVYYLDINEFNGRREVQLRIVDLRPVTDN